MIDIKKFTDPDMDVQRSLGYCCLAGALNGQGKFQDAIKNAEYALYLAEKSGNPENLSALCKKVLGDSKKGLGLKEEAAKCYTEALELYGRKPGCGFEIELVRKALDELKAAK
jgi:tetratricopeptide (TPR) repeat protein